MFIPQLSHCGPLDHLAIRQLAPVRVVAQSVGRGAGVVGDAASLGTEHRVLDGVGGDPFDASRAP